MMTYVDIIVNIVALLTGLYIGHHVYHTRRRLRKLETYVNALLMEWHDRKLRLELQENNPENPVEVKQDV